MKWNIWVEPNQIFTEDYPDGWSTADVERAADNRYGGKVTCVSPAGLGGSDTPRRSGGGGGSTGGLGALVWIGIGIVALAAFGGGEDDKSPAPTYQSAPIERSYTPTPTNNSSGPCVTANYEPC